MKKNYCGGMKAVMNVAVVLWSAAPTSSPGPLPQWKCNSNEWLLSRLRYVPNFHQVDDAGDLMCPELSTSVSFFFFSWIETSSCVTLRLAVTSISSGCDCRTWISPALQPRAPSQALQNCCQKLIALVLEELLFLSSNSSECCLESEVIKS